MNLPIAFFFIFAISSLTSEVRAQNFEVERLSGFAKHHNEDAQYEKARQQGERAFLEEEEQWENKKSRDLLEYKKRRKAAEIADDGPEARQDAAQKSKEAEAYQKERDKYLLERSKKADIARESLGLPSEATEFGLDVSRPRYDFHKRKYGKSTASSGGFGGSRGSSPPFGGSNNNNFPPPPVFDDFQDGGFVPPPVVHDDYMDVPPPPPPPPPPPGFDESYGGPGLSGEGGDFPPPPPPFGGGEGEF